MRGRHDTPAVSLPRALSLCSRDVVFAEALSIVLNMGSRISRKQANIQASRLSLTGKISREGPPGAHLAPSGPFGPYSSRFSLESGRLPSRLPWLGWLACCAQPWLGLAWACLACLACLARLACLALDCSSNNNRHGREG